MTITAITPVRGNVSANLATGGSGVVPATVVVAAGYSAAGPLVSGTSNSTNILDTIGSKNFVVNEYNRSFFPGMRLRAAATGFTNTWMEGVVTAWDGQTVTITPDLTAGGGTFTSWEINCTGQPGVQGPTGPTGPIGPSGGATGPAGPQGTPGSVWRDGTGVPPNSLGVNGDYYLNDATGDVYTRAAGVYAITGNIKGPVGGAGSVGPVGPAGPTGASTAWHDGTGVPVSTLGANGDYYLDDATGFVYSKTAGTWNQVATIKGSQGIPGPTGPQGIIADAPADGAWYGRINNAWGHPPGGGDVQHTLTLTAGAGLTGGGDLSANRTFDVGAGAGITVNPDSVALTVPVAVANGGTGAITAPAALTALGAAPLASPIFTGDPQAPTPAVGDNDTSIATTAYATAADTAVKTALVDGATSLTTLGKVENYINASITPVINNKADKASPVFTGDPQAPTPSSGDNDNSVATTAFVTAAVAAIAGQGVFPRAGLLTFVSASQLKFAPYYGNRIKINGNFYVIPAAGIAGLGNSSVFINGGAGANLAANTTYWIFAFVNAGVVTADFRSSATHTPSTTAGNEGTEILTGDDTRSLIGMCRTGVGTPGVFQWAPQASPAILGVLNWFNRRPLGAVAAFTVNRSVASGTMAEINSEIRVNFLSWGDAVQVNYNGVVSNDTASGSIQNNVVADGVTYLDLVQNFAISVAGYGSQLAASGVWIAPTEGYHYVSLWGSSAPGQTGTWYGNTFPPSATKFRTVLSIRFDG
jgi:hypothetical protein